MGFKANKKIQIYRISLLTFTIVTLGMFQPGAAQDLEIKTFVDQTRMGAGQQFTLTIQLSGSDAQSVPVPNPPDISAFADYIGSGSSQNYQLINNRMSVFISSNNYDIARNEGKHQIPAISFVFKDKTYHSQPINIEITKGSSTPASPQKPGQTSGRRPSTQIQPETSLEGNLFLKLEADRQEVYPNQPVNVTYKIFTRVEVTNYAISKLPSYVGFWSEDFEMPQQVATHEEIVNGEKFLVAEIKKMALYPTSSGKKTIEPMEIDLEVRLREQNRSQDIFDRFFDDDMFSSSLFGRRMRTRITTESLSINVKSLPVEGKPLDFSGIVGNIKMVASIDNDRITAHEAITLKVRFSGTGNIRMIPEPKILFPSDFETYEPKVSQNLNRREKTIKGNKTFEYVLLPRYAGEYRIKPFTFNYFDPAIEKYQTLSSQEFSLRVAAGAEAGTPLPSGLSRKEVEFIGRDIRFIKQSSEKYLRIGQYFFQSFWFGLLLIVPLVALGSAWVYKHRQDKMVENVAYARSHRANQIAKKRLGQAHRLMKIPTQKEFYAEISRALLGFIADKLNLAQAGLMTDDAAEKLKERQVEDPIISDLLGCLRECDFQRFAPADVTMESMQVLYNRARSAIINLEKEKGIRG